MTAYRIEIGSKSGPRDARGQRLKIQARQALQLPLQSVQTRMVYKIDAQLTRKELQTARKAFTDPLSGVSAIGRLRPPRHFDWLIEIGFLPGVTDNAGRVARLALSDALARALEPAAGVYSATQYFIRAAALTREQVLRLSNELLANPLLNSCAIYTAAEWIAQPPDTSVPVIRAPAVPPVHIYNLQQSDAALMQLSQDNCLSLSLTEMLAIRDHYASPASRSARQAVGLPEQPTDVELECLAQTWSEHCSHKIFAARIHYRDEQGPEQVINSLFATYIKGATEKISRSIPWLVSVFSDNAGIIRYDQDRYLVYKAETHNSPSALDPYGGAMTGIVGVNRDPMGTGLGATLICNVWGYCLGSPFYTGDLPTGLMHPRRIRDGVHQGAIEGGNQSGIPWARGWEIFDERFLGKPLVFCGTVGLLPATIQGRASELKEIMPGDIIVMLGGRIGKDSIHGATFSSEELHNDSPVQVVQIADPLLQRQVYEFLMEARDRNLYRCITDNGAGGLSCSVGEMARLTGGAELDLAKAPLKYEGLQPWEILVSEAQERMTLAVAPEKLAAFMELARRRDVEASALGTFTTSGYFLIRHGTNIVGQLDMNFLYRGCPLMVLQAQWTPPKVLAPQPARGSGRTRVLRRLLASLNICSKVFKSRQYDGDVKALGVVRPYVGVSNDIPSDASVLRLSYTSPEGIILAEGINPFYADLDTYWMMAAVIDEAVRRIISVGGQLGTIAGLDNFCWPDPVESEKTPDGRYKLAQLVRANRALYDVTTAYLVPCISGKDSCKNDSTRGGRKISIPPTVLFSTLAPMADVRLAITMDLKQPGDSIYIIGLTHSELGASAYHRMLAEEQNTPQNYGGQVPRLDTELALKIYAAMYQAIQQGLLQSSHTPTQGGLAVAAALSALGGGLGAQIDLDKIPATEALSLDARLFSESNSRFIVSVSQPKRAAFEALFKDLPCAAVGSVTAATRLIITGGNGRELINSDLAALRQAFQETLHGL